MAFKSFKIQKHGKVHGESPGVPTGVPIGSPSYPAISMWPEGTVGCSELLAYLGMAQAF